MSTDRHDLSGKAVSPIDRTLTKLLYVSTAKYGGDWNSLLHAHAFTELFFVVGGVGQFKFPDRLVPVSANDLVLINPNVEHTEVSLNASPLEYIVLGVSGLEFRLGEDGDDFYSIINLQNSAEDILFYLRTMLREIEGKAPGYETVCQDLLELLLISLLRHTRFALAVAAPVQRSSKECAAVRRYIDSHFKETITLDMLSELSHLNKYYMVHAFGREYGVSPINYLIDCRIRESCHLLAETDHPLARISHMLGFSSPSYFSQSFRRLRGMSPMEYRRQKRDGETVGGGQT